MKIRIFALAKELGIDSKVLIQHCNDAGLSVKSSPLASITPDERDMLVKQLESVEVSAPSSEPVTPVRDTPPDVSRPVRQMRSLGPLGGTLCARKGETEESVAEVEPAEPQEVAAPVAETGIDASDVVPADDVDADEVADSTVESEVQSSEIPEGEDQGGVAEGEKPKVTPISRSDYVAPTGAGLSGIREMKPRASIREADQKSKRDKKKSAALPSVATPSFKPPAPSTKKEGPVQKPDVKLNAEFLTQGNKLSDILKKHKDDTKKGPEDQEDKESSTFGKQLGLD